MKSELGIMIQSPFEEFEEWIQKIAENRLPELRKCQFIYNLCKDLKDKGLIDGIGMQGYWGIDYPSTSSIGCCPPGTTCT